MAVSEQHVFELVVNELQGSLGVARMRLLLGMTGPRPCCYGWMPMTRYQRAIQQSGPPPICHTGMIAQVETMAAKADFSFTIFGAPFF